MSEPTSKAEESARRYVKNVAGSIADSIETLGKKYIAAEKGMEQLQTENYRQSEMLNGLYEELGSTTGHQTALQIIEDNRQSRDQLRLSLSDARHNLGAVKTELERIRGVLSVPDGASAADAVQLLVTEINGLRAGYRSGDDKVILNAKTHQELLDSHQSLKESNEKLSANNSRLAGMVSSLQWERAQLQQKIEAAKNAL